MSASWRPTDIKPGDYLVVLGIQGVDFGEDTYWGEHSFITGTVCQVIEVIPPKTYGDDEPPTYGFYCRGNSSDGEEHQTLSETEVRPYILPRTPEEIEVFLHE